jgi:tRNA threonylcarbamoyladenosine biosynthesis protein TsaE
MMTYSVSELSKTAKHIIDKASSKLLCLKGEMGAGKTTLIKALIAELGCEDSGQSPSFGIVNTYEDSKGHTLAYHFDFYRIEDEEEAYDIGIEDYFNFEGWIFIEWSERIVNLLPERYTEVQLTIDSPESRTLTLIEH